MPNDPLSISYLNATDLYQFMMKKIGKEWLDMEPAALWEEMEEQGMTMDDGDRDCIMGLRTAIRTNAPWKDYLVFLNTVSALNGLGISPQSEPELSPSQIAWGITQLKTIDPDAEFSDNVKMLTAGIVFQHGLYWIPPSNPLHMCSKKLLPLLWARISSDKALEEIVSAMEAGYQDPAACTNDIQRIHAEKLHIIDEYIAMRGGEIA
jgi:hypothetical protein